MACAGSGSWRHPSRRNWNEHAPPKYPTFAYKCRRSDCWEFVFLDDYCDRHKPNTHAIDFVIVPQCPPQPSETSFKAA